MSEDGHEPKRKPGRPATGRTPVRSVLMSQARWEHLGVASTAAGSNRSQVLNELAAWYLREPHAKLPKRPDVPAEGAEDDSPDDE